MRQLRRVSKLGRYVRERQKALERLMKTVQVTVAELEVLCTMADGYLLVTDAREQCKHITLSDADELSRKQAHEREERREKLAKQAREKRNEQIEIERKERRDHKLETKKKKLLELAAMMRAAGVSVPLTTASK